MRRSPEDREPVEAHAHGCGRIEHGQPEPLDAKSMSLPRVDDEPDDLVAETRGGVDDVDAPPARDEGGHALEQPPSAVDPGMQRGLRKRASQREPGSHLAPREPVEPARLQFPVSADAERVQEPDVLGPEESRRQTAGSERLLHRADGREVHVQAVPVEACVGERVE